MSLIWESEPGAAERINSILIEDSVEMPCLRCGGKLNENQRAFCSACCDPHPKQDLGE